MNLSLSSQIANIRRTSIGKGSRMRTPKKNSEFEKAMRNFADRMRSVKFEVSGEMGMGDLRATIEEQVFACLDGCGIDSRMREVMAFEIPFGVATVTNIIEVTPRVVKQRGLNLDPRDIIAGNNVTRAASGIAACPGHIAPTIRKNFIAYIDDSGQAWVRASSNGSEQRDSYAPDNFDVVEYRKGTFGLAMVPDTYQRTTEECRAEGPVNFGGCPAIKVMMESGYPNLIFMLSEQIRDTSLRHFNFEIPEDPLQKTTMDALSMEVPDHDTTGFYE